MKTTFTIESRPVAVPTFRPARALPLGAAELVPPELYERLRPQYLEYVIAWKRRRRVQLGEHATLVFENRDTALFQVQEIIRAEGITDPDRIEHELHTYDVLVPGAGELVATVLIHHADRSLGQSLVDALGEAPSCLALWLGTTRIGARPLDEGQPLGAVVYVRFRVPPRDPLDASVPSAAVELSCPPASCSVSLATEVAHELYADLSPPPTRMPWRRCLEPAALESAPPTWRAHAGPAPEDAGPLTRR